MTFSLTKDLDIAWPLRTAFMRADFGRHYVFILQILCVTFEVNAWKVER